MIITQMATLVRKTPLYKPAVLAKLLDRADVSLFVTFQKYISLEQRRMVFSPYFASFIGVETEGLNAYLGFPEKLWPSISRIDWQSFSIDETELQLTLNFNVDVTRTKERYTSYEGKVQTTELGVDGLSLCFPINVQTLRSISKASIFHLCAMNDEHERTAHAPISITKIVY
ncbi:hypothetical protein [Vibrio sp. Hal054]|uniref:hypothetical protein n=1 Tax=Vibrio sp. Hal054 TaxID=3035158 RepID=UPI00301D539B